MTKTQPTENTDLAEVNGIKIAYERLGNPDHPTILLIMGLGGQLVMWPDSLCGQLVDAGFQVIRYDNRDTGLSTKFDHYGSPKLPFMAMAATLRRPFSVPYRLEDMARDAVGLLDALKIPAAHIVGVSMGGMIAQVLGTEHHSRVLSLSLLMTTSGHPRLPGPSLKLRMRLIRRRSKNPDQALKDSIRTFELIGSPGYPQNETALHDKLKRQIQRNVCAQGPRRQLAAIFASGSRARNLHQISAPTLVMHGQQDPLIPVAAAYDLARRIPHASTEIIPGMGHDLPEALVPQLGKHLLRHITRACRN